MSDLVGQELNDYRLLRRLGQGAMAEVYLAEQKSLGRQVAVKVLSEHLTNDATYVQRFQHEARAAAALVHANIVQIYEVGNANGRHFIAQEYVPGQNLGELLTRRKQLEPGMVLDILRQVTAGLGRAAERGIVHRDIKPENIMLSRSGEVKVADFGLARADESDQAKLTQAGVTMGTPLYMSPEQIEGRPVDARSDIYSLGVAAYHMLAGEPPFEGDTPLAVAVKHLNVAAPPLVDRCPAIPISLARVIDRMIAKAPDKRFASPLELLTELRSVAKQAADEGWGEGPSDWSALELSALSGGAATARLAEAMKVSAQATLPKPRWPKLAGQMALAALVGLGCAQLVKPRSLLASAAAGPPIEENERRQLFRAKLLDTPAAWQAVQQNFPNADPFYHALAWQGLARLHFNHQDYTAALDPLTKLTELPAAEQPTFHRFGLAGLVVAHTELGDPAAAIRAKDQLTSDDLNELRREEPALAEALRASEELD